MIAVRCYALPVHDAYVLWVPPATRDRLPGMGFLTDRQQSALSVDLFIPAGLLPERVEQASVMAAVRAAALEAWSRVDAAGPSALPGPRGWWVALLIVWGVLLALFSGGNSVVVLAGLWLAVGLPWFRAAYLRRLAGLAAGSGRGLGALGGDTPIARIPHEELTALEEIVSEASDVTAGSRAAALACERWGLEELGAAYWAVAAEFESRPTSPHVLVTRAATRGEQSAASEQ